MTERFSGCKYNQASTLEELIVITEITDHQRTLFCGGKGNPCDYFNKKGICTFGINFQERAVRAEYCGLAMVKEQKGIMTSEGFQPEI
ncbi:MAG TPA: hypothetical protein VJL83_05740 [Patescibacteria group bacterium]|nr:hypothetical protein [Patescibacteria group bacterium]